MFALGVGERLVGVSHQCDYPAAVRQLPAVTRSRVNLTNDASSGQIDAAVRESSESQTPLYDLDVERIGELNPDLILTQTLCNVCAVSENDVLRAVGRVPDGCMVVDLRGQTFVDVLADARMMVDVTGGAAVSFAAVESLEKRIAAIRDRGDMRNESESVTRPRVTLLEWIDPLFCAGHWTPELIRWAGGTDPIGQAGERSRQIDFAELRRADPDVLLIACCGLSVERARVDLEILKKEEGWDGLKCVSNDQVHLFDGSAWFNRPGPRLVDALSAVARLVDDWRMGSCRPSRSPSS